MHISWLGQTCVKLQTKFEDQDINIIIDPYRPDTGEFPRSFSPQIAIYSKGQENTVTLSGTPFIMDTLGEFETKEIMVMAYPGEEGNIIYRINAESMSIVHLGRMSKKPNIEELEKIGSIDILLLPVGNNKTYLNAEDAASIVTALEPRIIIPIAYQCDSDKSAAPVSEFIKETGIKPEITDKKIILKKKDLPQDDTKMIVLEKNI